MIDTTELERIMAPFTEEQVGRLNQYQRNGFFHPFTCPHRSDERHKRARVDLIDGALGPTEFLIATKDGWVCPCCDYKQDWAHKFMSEKNFLLTAKETSFKFSP